ncbi:LysR family transcriptional regulator [Litorisediminicola beolgyonensis]|uniref:LysR family transcriptional regulator n=1 Tax=Litorisediminicola beolgyonensis TaxID=1173614 RepID=A0ABW3ZML7_9RHOB
MARLNLEHLRSFLAVTRLGGVRKAATAMHLTQPAVTARIKALEDTVGAALFDREGGGMRLTKRGELLLSYAEKFEHLSEMVTRDVISPESLEGRLRLGVSETIAQCWLPDLIALCHARYPNLDIEFDVDISLNLRDALIAEELDLAILLGPISDYSVDNLDLPGFALEWYVSAEAPELADPSGHFAKPVLTYARQTRPYRELRSTLFERVGPDVRLFPSSSLLACFRLVEANLGVAALPADLARPYLAAGTIRRFDPGWVPQPLFFTASFRANPRNQMAETVAQMAQSVAFDYANKFS